MCGVSSKETISNHYKLSDSMISIKILFSFSIWVNLDRNTHKKHFSIETFIVHDNFKCTVNGCLSASIFIEKCFRMNFLKTRLTSNGAYLSMLLTHSALRNNSKQQNSNDNFNQKNTSTTVVSSLLIKWSNLDALSKARNQFF